MFAAKLISTCFGIGYLQKGAGTLAAIMVSLAWLLLPEKGIGFVYYILMVTLIFFCGQWASGIVEKQWGHDSNRIVVDEVLGMTVAASR